jgi:cytochrome c551/c552
MFLHERPRRNRRVRQECGKQGIFEVMMRQARAAAVLTAFICGNEVQAVAPEEAAVLGKYCVACHNAKVRTSGLAIDTLLAAPAGEHLETWEKVARRLATRFMPPANAPRPDEATYRKLTTSLTAELDHLAGAKPNPGRTDTFRRLTRIEYQNAIRDLIGIEADVTALLPADESSHGFDNITVGDLSPTLLERYLGAARKVSRLAIGIAGKSPGGDTFVLPPDLTQEERFDELPLGTRGGLAMPYTFPVDATYEFHIRLSRDRNEEVEGLRTPHHVELMIDEERIALFTVKPAEGKEHAKVDRHLTIRVPVKAGSHVVAATFPKEPTLVLETERQPYQAHFNMYRHPRIHPAVYSLTVNGPYDVKGPGESASRKRILICKPAVAAEEEECASRILMGLARRAYRRAVTASDISTPLRLYRETRTGEGFEAGIEMGLRAILVSPEFLFRIERDPAGTEPGKAYRIGDAELATRLSFFLWSSIPDEELLDLAIRGRLRSPGVLDQQVRRMIRDRRSGVLATNFAGQWLYLRNLASVSPDMRIFPDFDDNLRQALRRETEMFFDTIVREDRSALELIKADFTFMNERLARHYGIPSVYGSRFRRVALGEGSARGGLLSQGSVLTVTSYATRTSPVIRGKWIMENLLGVAPPPAPAVVPALKENGNGGRFLSMRERLSEHRDNPACSGCHQLMDPVGFSLENFDAIGRWRTQDGTVAIDAGGGLPDGSRFEALSGLQKALLDRPELFTTTLTEKLMTYALGRGTGYHDAPAIRKIVHDARAQGFRLSSFIIGIVESAPFQMRRSQ